MKPPTMNDAVARRLVDKARAIHTFSNGTEWDYWADRNCYACAYWDADTMGAACAFEAASFMGMATPELAALFGWLQRTTQYGPLSGWHAPDSCRFFHDRTNDDGTDYVPQPDPDPLQMVLIADPTEDASVLGNTPLIAPTVIPQEELASHEAI